jgi:glutathionyl-hydroquinone reductase
MSFIDEKTQTDNKNINLFLSMEIYDLSKILKFNETARKALAVAILYDTEDCTVFQMHSAEIISSLVRLFVETLKSVYANIDELYDKKVNDFVNFLQTTVDEIYN